jgi:hypothetical protein
MLRATYEAWRSRRDSAILRIADEFYPPLLVAPPQGWAEAKHRIAYVGQETLRWVWTKAVGADGYACVSLRDFFEHERAIEWLLDGYPRQPTNYRGLFWRFFRQLKEAFGRDGETVSAVFSNVIRCATNVEGGCTLRSIPKADRRAFLRWQNGLLRSELRALHPTLIVFVTGPYYDDFLSAEFAELTFEPLRRYAPRVACRLNSPELAAPAYRTYHPGYLNRRFGFAPIEAIISDVR